MGKPMYGNCVVCGKNGRIAAKGMCWKHYARFKRTGTTDKRESINVGKTCKVDDCSAPAKVQGLCLKHHRRWVTHGNFTTTNKGKRPEVVYNKNECVVPSCREPVCGKELCYNHYTNYKYHRRKKRVETVFDYLRYRDNA